MPTFTPPTVDEGPAGLGRLFYRYKLTRGETVIQTGGTFSTVRYPAMEDLAAADAYWIGGHSYDIDQATADALTAAGYGAFIT